MALSKSTKAFDRWTAHDKTTWSFQIFSQYDDQLGKLVTSHANAMKYAYKNLGNSGAQWNDSAKDALGTGDRFLDAFRDLEHWSDTYNLFDNWINLNSVLTAASNLETYMAGIVDLAIESDPGLLFGSTRAIDGASLLKRGSDKIDTEPHIVACTKGDWSARLAALQKLIGPLPSLVTKHHADLEDLRVIRNRVGHAFGRDIAEARNHGVREFRPMEKLRRERAYDLARVCRTVAREIDRHILSNFVGDFETIRFFARHHQDGKGGSLGERAIALKTAVGRIGAQPRGKLYCRGLIEYWDAL